MTHLALAILAFVLGHRIYKLRGRVEQLEYRLNSAITADKGK